MTTLELWLRPAVLVSIWILVAAYTLAELGTARSLLRSSGAEPPQIREPAQRTLEGRTQPIRRRAIAR